jgi:hypothetical protein
MTRTEKLKAAAQAYIEKHDNVQLAPDEQFRAFRKRRSIQVQQIRYWARIGHELPSPRPNFKAISQGLAALK